MYKSSGSAQANPPLVKKRQSALGANQKACWNQPKAWRTPGPQSKLATGLYVCYCAVRFMLKRENCVKEMCCGNVVVM